ncbi:MAG TPA: hypothetical protein VFC70_01265, partial [Oscillospiraceae bacterium]|nr:hypothetical protein [Oscillospiraceae bacterium]
MNYATWNEILIELVFAVSGETKLEKLAEKAAVTFLRKLDCAQVSILQYKNNNLKPIFAVPHVLLRRKDYNELIVRLEKILKNSNKEFITFVEKNL